jgi:hypothetical protein
MQNEAGKRVRKEVMAVEVGNHEGEGRSVRVVTELDLHKERREEIL